ncbi:MAG TPA: DUF983 domain-containing protein [Aliiroseovarius sp.]|nr:DUF983 domain-containing protein [Aliiroseovarius sp.]
MSDTGPATGNPTFPEERPIWPAMRRGFRRRCPHCGTGQIFRGYLRVRDNCPVCSEELYHQRADDGPAYLTILIVGHILAPLLGVTYAALRPEPLVLASVFAVGTVALSLYLLPRLKGMMIAFQWAKYMHGFAVVPEPAEPVSTGHRPAEAGAATAE